MYALYKRVVNEKIIEVINQEIYCYSIDEIIYKEGIPQSYSDGDLICIESLSKSDSVMIMMSVLNIFGMGVEWGNHDWVSFNDGEYILDIKYISVGDYYVLMFKYLPLWGFVGNLEYGLLLMLIMNPLEFIKLKESKIMEAKGWTKVFFEMLEENIVSMDYDPVIKFMLLSDIIVWDMCIMIMEGYCNMMAADMMNQLV